MKLIENLSISLLEDYVKDSKKWDICITCGSFEKRCIKSSEIFSKSNVSFGISIIFNYKENDKPKNQKMKNIRRMKKNFNLISNQSHIFNTDSVASPSKGLKKFLKWLKIKSIDLKDKSILIDISTFTKSYFFLLIKILKEVYNCSKLYIVYTEPQNYSKNDENAQYVLTQGLDRIEPLPGFTGSSKKNKDALVIILGFEGNKAYEVFDEVNPDISYAINGFPSFQSGWHQISLENNKRFLTESQAYKNLFFSPSLDPFETEKQLSKIVNRINDESSENNIVISPLGTKMQALGVLLYAIKNKDVKVVYPFPSYYIPEYSKNCGSSWICLINLSEIQLISIMSIKNNNPSLKE